MNIVRLTAENIEHYLDAALGLQAHLVSKPESINADLFRAAAADDHNYFIGVEDQEGVLLGLGLISKVVDPVRIIGYVNNIVVHPDGRGQGLFTLIMDELEAKARSWGAGKVELTCSRPAVQGMYEERGYVHKDTHFYYLALG